MTVIMKYKNKVIWILLLVVIVSGIGIYGNRLFFDDVKGRAVTRISFNFEGVDEGLNPQGGTFDAQKIKSQEVLKDALDKLKWPEDKMDAQTLAKHIMIRGVVPNDVIGRILPSTTAKSNMQLQTVSGLTYHPTQYDVVFSLGRDMKISQKEAKLLMDQIVESYSEDFVRRYKDTQAIETAIVVIDPERYDYSEYIELTTGQLEIIKSYLASKEQRAKDFKSSVTGLSFSDLIAQVDLIQDVEVGNVKALLDSFVITKDSRQSAVVYENMVQRMKRESAKYKQESQVLKNIANGYEKDKTIVMGSGNMIQKPEKEELEDGPLYDQLVKEAALVDRKVNRINKQVQYYEGLLANLKDQNGGNGNHNIAQYTQEVEQSVLYISQQMEQTMTKIGETVDDYYETEVFAGSITPIRSASYQSSFRVNLIKDTMVLAVITFIMMLVGLIYLLWKKPIKESL